MQRLLDAGIATRRGIMNAHREAGYRCDPLSRPMLTQSEAAQDECMLLPLCPDMSIQQVDLVVSGLFEILLGVSHVPEKRQAM